MTMSNISFYLTRAFIYLNKNVNSDSMQHFSEPSFPIAMG